MPKASTVMKLGALKVHRRIKENRLYNKIEPDFRISAQVGHSIGSKSAETRFLAKFQLFLTNY